MVLNNEVNHLYSMKLLIVVVGVVVDVVDVVDVVVDVVDVVVVVVDVVVSLFPLKIALGLVFFFVVEVNEFYMKQTFVV